MQLTCHYSHLNGEEYLLVHHPGPWEDVNDVINGVDAEACRTNVSDFSGEHSVNESDSGRQRQSHS